MPRCIILGLVLLTSGCLVGTEGVPRVLVGAEVLDGGAICPEGGSLILAGIDGDGDEVLASSEVTSRVPLCDSEARGPQVITPPTESGQTIVVQSGRVSANFVIDKGWNLIDSADAGFERYFEKLVIFPEAFAKPPNVILGLTEVDTGTTANRVRVSAEGVTNSLFTLRVGTWGSDASIWGVTVHWMAYAD